jgi:uncharacterized repeat protein (TIGR01451 family)
VAYRPFYVVNMIWVRGDRALLTRLAARPDVARIVANPQVRMALPGSEISPPRARAWTSVEWGVARVNADDVWALGHTGEGVVVAGQDTGYDWDHPALRAQYRGWNGITATHDYHWHDAIHTNEHGANSCGVDSPAPCDDHGHGTHTMGTIVGSDDPQNPLSAPNAIGVAPGARWIGCRNMDNGYGSPATYAECFEFFLAPYPLGGDPFLDGDPDRAPHVINNSWGCPLSEGCDADAREILHSVVESVRAAGILVVASAGNAGSGCSSVDDPPAMYAASFSVGATSSSDAIASFSSRGPVTIDGSNRMKPDVSAPGVSVRSCVRGTGYGHKSGTSMAAPHVAGVAALLWSAAPRFVGDVDGTETLIERAARPRTTNQGCGGDGPTDVPNNVYGWGIVDALAAVQAASPVPTLIKSAAFPPGIPAQTLVYRLQVTNTAPVTLTNVVLTDTLPVSTTLAWASAGYGRAGDVISWTVPQLTPGAALTVTLAVTVAHLPRGTEVINQRYGVDAHEMLIPTGGAPLAVRVPWRLLVVPVYRDWIP